MNKTRFYIEKVLNNNSIVVKTSKKDSKILIGKGIGFHQKAHTYTMIDLESIEKSFFNYDETLKNQLINIISYIDEDIVEISNEIIALAEDNFGKLNQHIYVSLTDHISFAIDRLKNNQTITNPFQSSIQVLLKKEYEVAKKGKDIIQKKLDITIPEEEIGFIAFHINAARENIKVNFVVLEMRIYKELIKMIEECIKHEVKSELKADLYYIIQSIIKKESLPLQFLINPANLNKVNFNKDCKNLLDNIIHYIESNINDHLSKNQIYILKSYILHITRSED
jgi:transcriptional antiterminator